MDFLRADRHVMINSRNRRKTGMSKQRGLSGMRLICPNCAAQYEVPTEVIPAGGRDVQCSNCAHTWFQKHPDEDADLAEELGHPLAEEHGTDWAEEPEQDPTPDPSPEPAPRPQRKLPDDVADVLREEAALEQRQREAETRALETQPDLGLDAPDEAGEARRAREARERMAFMRGEQNDDTDFGAEGGAESDAFTAAPRQADAEETGRASAIAAAAAAADSRRDLLPDIEEINQSLRPESDRRVTDAPDARDSADSLNPAPRGGGFARGFFLVILLAAAAIAVYAMAPQISASLPAVAPALEGYVAFVDGLRIWLDGQITPLLGSLDSMSSETAPAE
jgi:predicted Zn finger-like uncharacterized protein